VEITFVGHTFPDFPAISKDVGSFREIKEYIDRRGGPIVVNYRYIREFTHRLLLLLDEVFSPHRFIREFTKGVEDPWRINAVNHFYLADDGGTSQGD
jgi:hypothetical protein